MICEMIELLSWDDTDRATSSRYVRNDYYYYYYYYVAKEIVPAKRLHKECN